jgi:hypothetical protein
MDLYTKIHNLLKNNESCRNSYKELRWRIWEDEGTVVGNSMTKSQYLSGTDAETIRRTAQKVFENHPDLKPKKDIQQLRLQKEKTGGHFVWKNQKPKLSRQWYESALSALRMKWGAVDPAQRVGDEWENDKARANKYKEAIAEDTYQFTSNLFKPDQT